MLTKLLVTTGLLLNREKFPGEIVEEETGLTEIVNLDGTNKTCQSIKNLDHPGAVLYAHGGFLNNQDPLICGGTYFWAPEPPDTSHCFFLGKEGSLAIPKPRLGAASTMISDSTLWITGICFKVYSATEKTRVNFTFAFDWISTLMQLECKCASDLAIHQVR